MKVFNPKCPVCGIKLKRFAKQTFDHPYQTFRCPSCKILFNKKDGKLSRAKIVKNQETEKQK